MGQSKRYEEASSAYKDAMNRYTGQNAWDTAKKQAAEYAGQQSAGARNNAVSAARSTGMNKAKAYSNAASQGGSAYTQGLQQGMSSSLANSNAAMSANQGYAQQLMDRGKQTYQENMGTTSAVAGTVGSLLNTIGNAVSDERLKDINEYKSLLKERQDRRRR